MLSSHWPDISTLLVDFTGTVNICVWKWTSLICFGNISSLFGFSICFSSTTSYYNITRLAAYQTKNSLRLNLIVICFLEYREAMSKPRESGGPEELKNDIEFLSEPSCSFAHLSALEHYSDVCEWTVSSLSRFMLGKKTVL